MTLEELMKQIEKIRKLTSNAPEAPGPDDPDLYKWAKKTDMTIDEILAIVERLLE